MLDPWYADKSYSLPLVAPGQEALIIDADYEWEIYNGRSGNVIAYSFFTGLHTIEVDGIWPTVFLGREIMKAS